MAWRLSGLGLGLGVLGFVDGDIGLSAMRVDL